MDGEPFITKPQSEDEGGHWLTSSRNLLPSIQFVKPGTGLVGKMGYSTDSPLKDTAETVPFRLNGFSGISNIGFDRSCDVTEEVMSKAGIIVSFWLDPPSMNDRAVVPFCFIGFSGVSSTGLERSFSYNTCR